MMGVAEAAAAHGFEVVDSCSVSEIDGSAHRMLHTASGAKLLFLQNADSNKAFAITFKTPAFDDTGVFHILEHSVLCGSDRFPVKEPFVDLLKGSMQTFLNAMTFPDKTMYPVASTNDQDLMNLMDVYMDAVFHPRIYRKPTIFEQEGWHSELAEGDDGLELRYNGVVFNEMKGALSDPDAVLYDTLSAALFPDTTYRFESGGIPASIVDLDYEGFLAAHRKHYRADNSYIVLYGDIDIDRVLAFLDTRYLTPLAQEQSGAHERIAIAVQQPVVATGVKREMCTSPEGSCAAFGFVAGDAHERERLIAADIVVDALLGSNEAPLKRAILDAQIADDCMAYLEDGIMQPFVMVGLRGLREGAPEELGRIIRDTCTRLADGELDRELIRASLAHAEFVMREHDMGYADGVVYAMAVMSGWLYGDDMALDYIRYEDAFASLRAKVDEGYFENLIASLFLQNDHYAQVEIVPVEGDADAALHERARGALAAMGEADLEAVRREEAALRDAQQTPDTPEALATLPRLTIDQIGAAPDEPPFRLEEGQGTPVLRHRIPSHGIMYAYRYFDLGDLSFEELPYAGILAMLLGKLGTAERTAAELDLAVQSKLGALSFFTEVHERVDGDGFAPKLVVAVSALSSSASDAARLADEVISGSDFDDLSRVYDLLVQRRVSMEQGFASAGHTTAVRRAASYHNRAALVREQLGGVDFYRFLKALIEGFDDRRGTLAAKLREVSKRVFTAGGCLLSFTGSDEDLERYRAASAELPEGADLTRLDVPVPTDLREALVVPSDVSYTALSSSLTGAGAAYSGTWPLLARALTYGYLWQEVRVLGGAYGTGFSTSVTGSANFYSYRDPHVDETLMRFRGAPTWVADFEPEPDEFAGYVVSSVAAMDAPCKPRERMRKQDGMHFSGYSPAMRARTRQQLVEATMEEVRALAGSLSRVVGAGHVCSVGGRAILEGSNAGLTLVDLVG